MCERIRFEEPGQYYIDAYKDYNHLRFVFYGPLKKASDIPNYVNHVKETSKLMKDGFTCLSHAVTGKNPGFTTTALFKDGMNVMAEAGLSKVSFVSAGKSIIHSMVIKVLDKLSRLQINIYDNLLEAEKWLGLNDEQQQEIANSAQFQN